jgi:hypothetical protein
MSSVSLDIRLQTEGNHEDNADSCSDGNRDQSGLPIQTMGV